jgi:carbonic anhydrase
MFLFLFIGVCLSQTEYLCGKGDRQSPIDVHDTFVKY